MNRLVMMIVILAAVLTACGEETGRDITQPANPLPGASGFLNAEPDVFTTIPSMAADIGPWMGWTAGSSPQTHMAITWGRASLHRAVFRLGTGPGELTNMILTNTVARRKHTFLCENLQPGTTYYYRVDDISGSNIIQEHSFRTAPASGQPFRFIFTSDTRPKTTDPFNDDDATATANALANDPETADAVLAINAGDIVDRGRPQDWHLWIGKHWKDVLGKWPVVPANGNHDYDEWNTVIGKQQSFFKDIFSLPGEEWFYRLDMGRTRFLVLDTGWTSEPKAMDLYCREGQLAFLDSQLALAQQDKTAGNLDFLIVVMHKGIGNAGNHGNDEDIVSLRAQLGDRFREGGVDFVLQSHEHSWQRNTWNGVFYFVNGTGGSWREGENGELCMDRAPSGLVNHFFTKELGYALIDINGRDAVFTHRTKDYVDADTARYRLITVTYSNPRGWAQIRMRYANAFTGNIPVWCGPEGRPMTPNGDGSFSVTLPVMRNDSGEYRLLTAFSDGAGDVDDNYGDNFSTTGDNPLIAGTTNNNLQVSIASPAAGSTFTNSRSVLITGTAAADSGDAIIRVQVSLNNGSWEDASGAESWTYSALLSAGTANTIRARAVSGAGLTNTSSVITVNHAIVPIIIIDGIRDSLWDNSVSTSDTNDNAGSVPASAPEMNLKSLYLTNDGYHLFIGWETGTNTVAASTIWYLAMDTGTEGGATNMAGFGQSSYSMKTSWSGMQSPDFMVFFKYKTSADAGLNGFWVSRAADGTAVITWDTTGAVVDHNTGWAEARISLQTLGLTNNQTIRCWMGISKTDKTDRALFDTVPRLGPEWPYGGSWSVPDTQDLVSSWLSCTLSGVEYE